MDIAVKRAFLLITFFFLPIAACSERSANSNISENLIYERETAKPFDDAILDLEFAIGEKNFRIIETLKIGNAINERGDLNFPRNEVIIFCNLSHAEKMLSIYPEFIAYCPFRATIRETDNKVFLSTMLLPEKDNSKAYQLLAENINQILKELVNYAVEDDPFILEGDYENET